MHTKTNLTNNPVKHFLILFSLCIFSSYCLFGQKTTEAPSLSFHWTKDGTAGNVEFYHAVVDCKGKNVVFLKFINKNSYPVKFSWEEKFTTQHETGVSGAKGRKELIISNGITVASGCEAAGSASSPIVIKGVDVQPHYTASISAFAYAGVKVEKAN